MSAPRRAPRRNVDGILLLDKPEGLTSNAVLQRVKRLYNAGKAGHTGSLDPIATGLLPICFGQATKLSGFLLDGDKRYRVRAKLGVKTSTGDREGEPIAHSDPGSVTGDAVERTLPKFIGTQQQVPPMYSALKHEGQRLYELARSGVEVDRAPRAITIHELQLIGLAAGVIELDVLCSKGTYVRTLVEDVATSIGQVAHVVALRRTGAQPFWSPELVTVDTLEAAGTRGLDALDALLQPVAAGAASLPQVRIDDDRAFYLSRGQAVRVASVPDSQTIAVVNGGGRLLGIGRRDAHGMLAPSRWLS
ncbi:MAG TPA: tRNA pseudouridine(55) synthase TruB [Nevskiaceae bacterium]|nr:tRNA pseudouridine(55) synthase TruB [Nevskiaceae bacterium]